MDNKIVIVEQGQWYVFSPHNHKRKNLIFNFVKRLPKHAQKMRKISEYDVQTNSYKTQWYIYIHKNFLFETLSFLQDNRILYSVTTKQPQVLNELKQQFLQRKQRLENILKFRQEQINVENETYDYLKLTPYEHQKKAIKFFEISNGLCILADQPGLGKALWGEEKVFILKRKTSGEDYSNHYIPIKNITIGDVILDRNKNKCKVIEKHYVGHKQGYVITFNDKTKIRADNDHLWFVYINDNFEQELILSTENLYFLMQNNNKIWIKNIQWDEGGKGFWKYVNKTKIKETDNEIFFEINNDKYVHQTYICGGYINKKIGIIPKPGKLLFRQIIKIKKEKVKRDYFCIKTNSPDKSFVTTNYIPTHNTLPSIAYTYKHHLKTLIVTPASLKFMWYNEIKKYVNAKVYIYNYIERKNSSIKNDNPQEAQFFIINYDILDKYLVLKYKHKCHNKFIENNKVKKCYFIAEDTIEKHNVCPVCNGPATKITTKIVSVNIKHDKYFTINPEMFDAIIIDECHRMKELKTKWTKIIHHAFRDIKHKILLSGTIIKNTPMELFSLLSFLDPSYWKSRNEFGMKYCAGYKDKFGWRFDGVSNLEQLYQELSKYILRRLKKDVFDLPNKQYIYIPIELTDKEYKEYVSILKGMKSDVDEMSKTRETFISKIHKLKMFVGHIKANRLTDILEDLLEIEEKIVIMTEYIELAYHIYEKYKDIAVIFTSNESQIDRHEAVKNFRENDNIKLFIGTIIASGVGIDLSVASKLIKIGFSWTPADEEQVEDRIHRITSDKTKSIQIITLYCQDTIDEDIIKLLDNKRYIINKTIDNKETREERQIINEDIWKELVQIIKAQIEQI